MSDSRPIGEAFAGAFASNTQGYYFVNASRAAVVIDVINEHAQDPAHRAAAIAHLETFEMLTTTQYRTDTGDNRTTPVGRLVIDPPAALRLGACLRSLRGNQRCQ